MRTDLPTAASRAHRDPHADSSRRNVLRLRRWTLIAIALSCAATALTLRVAPLADLIDSIMRELPNEGWASRSTYPAITRISTFYAFAPALLSCLLASKSALVRPVPATSGDRGAAAMGACIALGVALGVAAFADGADFIAVHYGTSPTVEVLLGWSVPCAAASALGVAIAFLLKTFHRSSQGRA